MWVVRAVRTEDLDRLYELTQLATRGLTSLQLKRPTLLDRVEQSVFAFTRTGQSATGEPFVLVMTDTASGEVVGTATVYAKTGGYEPFYTYQLVTTNHHSESLGVSHQRTRLQLLKIHDGPTEIGSLFLRGQYRGQGRGRWLSLARFMLIAGRPHRFADRVIAEMRGRANPDGTVPFWEAVPGRFIPVEFATADAMSTVSKRFVEEMLPEHPIYLDLLDERVRAGIGRVHQETEPAVNLLRAEGFQATDQVDIFDAGPVLSCVTGEIDAVRRTSVYPVVQIRAVPPSQRPTTIVASEWGGFTSVLTDVELGEQGITIRPEVADVLGLEIGSTCYLLSRR